MKTVGTIIRDARSKKGVSLDQAESATKIRRKFLVAIEADDFTAMPSVSYAKAFVKNYSEFLGLDSATVLAFFRRQSGDVSKSAILPKGITEPLNSSYFQLTPKRFMVMFVACLVCLFLLYFGVQYRRIQKPPTLILQTPRDGSVVKERRADVLGMTDPDATVAINGINAQVHDDGKFFDQVEVNSRLMTVTVVSTSRYGKSTTVTRTVEYDGPLD